MLHLFALAWGSMLIPSDSSHPCQNSRLTSGATPRRTKGFVGAASNFLLSRNVPVNKTHLCLCPLSFSPGRGI